ncbi:uncharacterized protein LOC135206059 isoform X2 [Macrobrachium nipponense]|uniref:uncharacterized protein LOC135206059 isoform X2 n=1 Tax=Macrobrachium nipponense TaxID=159736 RepID=UPI0030C7A762
MARLAVILFVSVLVVYALADDRALKGEALANRRDLEGEALGGWALANRRDLEALANRRDLEALANRRDLEGEALGGWALANRLALKGEALADDWALKGKALANRRDLEALANRRDLEALANRRDLEGEALGGWARGGWALEGWALGGRALEGWARGGGALGQPPTFVCQEDGYFADFHRSCTVYYRCEGGVKQTFECPTGELFDEGKAMCVPQEDVQCPYPKSS